MILKKRVMIYGATLVLVGIIIGLGMSSNLNWLPKAYTEEASISKEAIDILSKTNQAMAEVVAAVKPAVVNISSTKTIRVPGFQSPFFDDPFFRRFSGDDFGQFQRQGSTNSQALAQALS
jgi:S1-C subfamily serine protease